MRCQYKCLASEAKELLTIRVGVGHTHSLHVTTIREVLFEVTALVLALESLRVAFGTLDAPSMVQTDLPVVHR